MSKPNSLAGGEQPDYIRALLSYLGEKDPLSVFAETPNALRAASGGLSETFLITPEGPAKWSVLQVVQHLGHTEVALGFRYRKVLAEDSPALPAIDQDRWVSHLYPELASLEESLEDFAALRAVNLRLLHRVTENEWTRHGIHSQRGKETLGQMVRLYAAHDCYHLHQIQRIRLAIGA